MWRREVLEELQPESPYADKRAPVWPDTPQQPTEYVLVGEAPGRNEVRQGHIFVGRAGQLLKEMLTDAGIQQYHLTNASLYRPTLGTVDAPPTQKVLDSERQRLLTEIVMLNPKAVVALGATASKALLGNVARMRGMVKEITIYGKTYPVYITHHPAAILYQPDLYQSVAEDFQRLVAGIRPLPVELSSIHLIPGSESTVFVSGTIAIDTESTSTHFPTAQPLCAVVWDGAVAYTYSPETFALLRDSLSRYSGRIIGHNSIGDEILLRRYGVSINFTDDSLLLHLSQDERRGTHGLKVLGPTIAGEDTLIDTVWPYTHPEEEEDTHAFKDIPMEVLVPYCAQDAKVTLGLFNALTRTSDERTNRLYSFLQRAHRAFAEGMGRGVLVNQELLSQKTQEQKEKVDELRQQFIFNPDSQRETLGALRGAGYKLTRTAREFLEGVDGELPRSILHYRDESKLLKGFLKPLSEWVSEDGRVRPTYKIHGTDSGRTSCADPNLQQVPGSLKCLFAAEPGKVFVGWDFKVHEVRGIGYYSQDEALLRFLQDPDADPHQLVANETGLDRRTAKMAVFAVAYGAGVGRLIKAGIDPELARKAYRTVGELFPGIELWRQRVIEQMYEEGYVETPYGRRRRFPYIDEHTSNKAERIAINFLPQSLCSDVCLDAAIQVYEQLKLPPLIYVHDFNCIEVKESKVRWTMKKIKEIAESIFPNPYVQFVPELYQGQTWADLKHQEGEDDLPLSE